MNNSAFGAIRSLFKSQGILFFLFLLTQLSIFNNDIHVYIKVGFCLLLLLSINKYHPVNNSGFRMLVLFSIINGIMMFFVGAVNSNFENFAILIGPVAYYLFGYRAMSRFNDEREFEWFFILFVLASNIMLWISNIQDGVNNGLVNISRAIVNEMGEEEHSATLQGLIAAISISCISYPIAKSKYFDIESVLFIIFSILGIYCTIHLVNRTGLFVFVLVVFAALLYSVRKSGKSLVFFLLFGVSFFYVLNMLGFIQIDVLDAYMAREVDSSTMGGGLRFDKWTAAFKYLFEYPFGWRFILKDVGYCHNLWLDVARCGGIIPFVLVLSASIKNYKNTFFLYKQKGLSINGFFVAYSFGLFLAAFVEPVIEAVSTFFFIMCMIWGMQQAYIDRNGINENSPQI